MGGMVAKVGRANAHGKHASGALVSGSRKDEVGVGGHGPRFLLTTLASVAWVALAFGHTNAYLWPVILAAAVAVYGAWKFDGWSALRRTERVAFVVLAVLLGTARIMERRSGTAGIGGGDVKLLAALGFCLGWEAGLAITGISSVLLVLHRLIPRTSRTSRGAAFAFAPYIAVASMFTMLFL